ncbi:TPA: acyltransferase [Escherichia coli]|nr:acyltransferase [Escherichia coli]
MSKITYLRDVGHTGSTGYLDGLRGICCLLVVIDHCINTFKPDLRYTGLDGIGGIIRRIIQLSPLNIIYTGNISVYIFFILSGYVLSIKYFRSRENKLILDGVIKRTPRLMLPVFASMVFIYIVYSISNHLFGSNIHVNAWSYIYESLVLVPFTHEPLTNYPLWTISYELFGSLIVFCLLSLFGTFRYRMLSYAVVFLYFYINVDYYYLFVFGLFLCDIHSNGMFKIGNKSRVFMFIIGLFLATTPLPRDGVEHYAGMYAYLKVFSSFDYLQVYRTIAMTGAMILFTSILGSSVAEKTLSSYPIKFLGSISFPLYLTHSCILYVIYVVAHKFSASSDISIVKFLILSTISILVSFFIAFWFEKFIDKPSIKFASRISKRMI